MALSYRKLDTKEKKNAPVVSVEDTKYDSGKKYRPLKCCCGIFAGILVLLIVAIIAMFAVNDFPPLHASCSIKWNVTTEGCQSVHDALIKQMHDWNGNSTCGDGQKCLYTVTTSTETELHGYHMTPVKHYIDDMTFNFDSRTNECEIKGYSTSRVWYAVLDFGTNYCNLHNLMYGPVVKQALDELQAKVMEDTNGNICTQYKSADCEKY